VALLCGGEKKTQFLLILIILANFSDFGEFLDRIFHFGV